MEKDSNFLSSTLVFIFGVYKPIHKINLVSLKI